MAPYAVHIVKQRLWRGKSEQFENVYHYQTPTINTESGWDGLVEGIVTQERPVFGTAVQFISARVHGPTNAGKEADVMQFAKDLTGTGSRTTGAGVAPELAAVVSISLGRSARGYKQFLRKYWHIDLLLGAASGDDAARGIGTIPSTARDLYVGQYQALRTIMVGAGQNVLCNPSGETVEGHPAAVCDPYLHTRQFRRGRKRKRVAA